MKSLVIDASTAIGFVLKDGDDAGTMKVLSEIERGTPTYVPAHWCVETANGLIMAERRKRASQAEITEALDLISAMPIMTDDETAQRIWSDTTALARQCGLTAYDAAYLELATRRGAHLATTDKALRSAARSVGVPLFAV
jgi:predicted nucleic acid-binding protein